MKFRAHDTFAIRKGWLHKGMRHLLEKPRLFVDKNINAMDELGIGSNMVKALRYWLQAFGLTKEVGTNAKQQIFTELGELIWENDTFMEEDGTYCILHYMLASNKELATAWYYFFNIYNMNEVTKDTFVNDIKTYISVNNDDNSVSDRALDDDYDCIIKTYVKNDDANNPESNIESPLTELGLIKLIDKKNKIYNKTAPSFATINPLIILAIIIKECGSKNNKDIKIFDSTMSSVNSYTNSDIFAFFNYRRLQNILESAITKLPRVKDLYSQSFASDYNTFNTNLTKLYKRVY